METSPKRRKKQKAVRGKRKPEKTSGNASLESITPSTDADILELQANLSADLFVSFALGLRPDLAEKADHIHEIVRAHIVTYVGMIPEEAFKLGTYVSLCPGPEIATQ